MHIKTRINLKRYFLISGATTVASCLIFRDLTLSLIILMVFVATLVNHACLVEIVEDMALANKSKYRAGPTAPVNKDKVLWLTALKIGILVGALSLGVLFVGNKIIIPLLNYVVMIFVLGISLQRRMN